MRLKPLLKQRAVLERAIDNEFDNYGKPLFSDPIEIQCIRFDSANTISDGTSLNVIKQTKIITDTKIENMDRIDGQAMTNGVIIEIRNIRGKVLGYEVTING